MKENLVSLAKLLATDDAFNLAFSSQYTDEEKYELAKTKFTDLAREDFSEFLEKLRETEENNLANLSPDELEMVAGGAGGWATKLAAAAMFVTALGATGVMSQQVDASGQNENITIQGEVTDSGATSSGAVAAGDDDVKPDGLLSSEEIEKLKDDFNNNKALGKSPSDSTGKVHFNGLPQRLSEKGFLALLSGCNELDKVKLEVRCLQALCKEEDLISTSDGTFLDFLENQLTTEERSQLSLALSGVFAKTSKETRQPVINNSEEKKLFSHLYGEFNAAGMLSGGGHLSDTKTYLAVKDELPPIDLGNGVCVLDGLRSVSGDKNKFKTFFPEGWNVNDVKDVATTVKDNGYQVPGEKQKIVWKVASVTHNDVNINVVVGFDTRAEKITTCFPLSDQKDASQHVLCDNKRLNKQKVCWFLPGWNTNPALTKDLKLGNDVRVFAPDGSTDDGDTITSNNTQFTITNSTCTMTKSNGSRTEYRTDGSRTEYRTDGSRTVYRTDGSYTVYYADRSCIEYRADGSRIEYSQL